MMKSGWNMLRWGGGGLSKIGKVGCYIKVSELLLYFIGTLRPWGFNYYFNLATLYFLKLFWEFDSSTLKTECPNSLIKTYYIKKK